ncbi:hypothetical protein CIK61_03005 [Brevibacterium aurantiacum]|uniref:Uncharacterized protein n=1 Tax=Brevibacterium aurantiacum TaxID=273384 RepID=A0A2A3X575_BREAU|nr:hypothetical protein CIK79_11500 [Brevibacterium aurantiacum]RCS97078.1 hypothetical protein CIK61_03005 [Brevibacterium aurantiacum]
MGAIADHPRHLAQYTGSKREGAMIMVSGCQWSSIRSMESAQLFVDEARMQTELRDERAQRRRKAFDYWWSRFRSLICRSA